MPKDLVRYQQTGGLHFVAFTCYRRRRYLNTPAMRVKHAFVINAHVVMLEHVHLLISEPKRAILAKAFQALKMSLSVHAAHV